MKPLRGSGAVDVRRVAVPLAIAPLLLVLVAPGASGDFGYTTTGLDRTTHPVLSTSDLRRVRSGRTPRVIDGSSCASPHTTGWGQYGERCSLGSMRGEVRGGTRRSPW
jgi:hypothetical protein